MANLRIEMLGKKKLVGILSALKGRVTNLKPAFKAVGDNFRALEKMTFDAQGRPTNWRPLSPKYAEWKAKKYPGKPIMVLTGDLRKSLVSTGGEHIQSIGRQSMTIGTKNKLGDFHQKGAGRLPVRKLISPRNQDINEWVNIIRGFIIEKLGFKRSGF